MLKRSQLKSLMSFLVVDDNSMMRRLIGRVVGEFADEIIECEDGTQAFSAYREHQPDWVLMDIEMPDQDGLSATREICAAYPGARVVIVTNYGDDATRAAAGRAGACAYVLKENLLELRDLLMVDVWPNSLDRVSDET
jgi:CheY-like chemotaxis protein